MIQVEHILTGFSTHLNYSESAKTCLRLRVGEIRKKVAVRRLHAVIMDGNVMATITFKID